MKQRQQKQTNSNHHTISMERKIGGEYQVEKLNENGEVIFESEWMPNIITDNFLDSRMDGPSTNTPRFCRVGTGTTEPSPSDIALQNQIAVSASSTVPNPSITSDPVMRNFVTVTYNFDLGAVVGNITEVGVSYTDNSALISRALFKDSEGNPTSITILADEQLRIRYRIYIIIPEQDVTGTIGDYEYLVRPLGSQQSTAGNRWSPFEIMQTTSTSSAGQWFTGDATEGQTVQRPSAPVNTSTPSSITASTYEAGSFTREYTLYWDTARANSTDLRTLAFGGSSGLSWQAQFTPAISKTNEDTLTITIRHSISRA